MAIVIDTTVAGTDANSYNTLSEANNYFEADLAFYVLWSSLTNEQKNAWLVVSTRAIDRYNFTSRKWKDFSFEENEQALEFPRLSDIRVDLIHPRVKKAQLEMLKYLYHNTDSSTGESEYQKINSIDVKDIVAVTFSPYISTQEQDSKQVVGSSVEAVEALLRPWLEPGLNDSGPFNWVR